MSKLMRLVEDAFFPRDFPTEILSACSPATRSEIFSVEICHFFVFCYSVPLFAAVSWGGLPCIVFIGVKLKIFIKEIIAIHLRDSFSLS